MFFVGMMLFRIRVKLSNLRDDFDIKKRCLHLWMGLKMDGWNTSFLWGNPIFRGYVSFTEGKCQVSALVVELWC